jgi:glutamine amidotransferase
VIVDVGMGNLHSVTKAVEVAARDSALEIVRSSDPEVVRRADRVVVPGQGGFGELSRRFANGLSEAILEKLRAGTPYFGICLGLQILFESSEEAPGVPGFGWFRGTVRRLVGGQGIKIPHMGWNKLELRNGGHAALDAAGGNDAWVYFVHSYHAVPKDPRTIRAVVTHGAHEVTAAVAHDNIFATQFHPEKSQIVGLKLLAEFLKL